MKKVGIIGIGAMGSALADVICDSVEATEVLIYDRNSYKSNQIAQKRGCLVAIDAQEVAREAEVILLAVKPQDVEKVMGNLLPIIKKNADSGVKQIFVSIAAGWVLEQLNQLFTDSNVIGMPIVRAMPNIAVKVKHGLTLFANNEAADGEITEYVISLFEKGGMCVHCDEELMVTSCAVFSCSPAMVYMFIESIADAGVQIGMGREQATMFAAQAVKGSAAMVLDSGKHIGQLKEELDTPGGMTIGGTNLMEQMGFRGATIAGVLRAHERQFGLS